jgi:hypothetical protein
MRIEQNSVELAGLSPDIIVRIRSFGVIPQGWEEIRAMEKMNEGEACGEIEYFDYHGRSSKHALRLFTLPPFDDRVFLVLPRLTGSREFLVYTRYAARVIFGAKTALENQSDWVDQEQNEKSPVFYVRKGKMKNSLCATIVTEDGKRGIKLCCKEANIVEFVNALFKTKVKAPDASPIGPVTEIVVIQTKTFDQALGALITYAPYLGMPIPNR